jgi:hypothetical protein
MVSSGVGFGGLGRARIQIMVWEKLKQLEVCCDVRIESFIRGTDALMWRITIRHRTDPQPPIVVEQADITDTIEEGLVRAQELGWLPCDPQIHIQG